MGDGAAIWAMCDRCQDVTGQDSDGRQATCLTCHAVHVYSRGSLRYEVCGVLFGKYRIIATDGYGVNDNW